MELSLKAIDELRNEANKIQYSSDIINMKRCCRDQVATWIRRFADNMECHLTPAPLDREKKPVKVSTEGGK